MSIEFNLNNDGFHGMLGFDEEQYEDFRDDLHELFLASPEGKSIADLLKLDEDGDPFAHWTEVFLDVLYNHVGRSLSWASANDVRDVLYNGFPHSVIIFEDMIPALIRELKAFFTFINREFAPYSGASCVKIFSQKNLAARLDKEFNDVSKFSQMKVIVIEAFTEGVDIEDEASLEKFFIAYNERMQAEYDALMNTPLTDKAQQKIKEVHKLVKSVCTKHLNQEYADVGKNMVDALAELRPCPLEDRSQAKSWAAGVVYAVGRINFLHDSSFEPYMKMTDLVKLFKIGQETASKKSREILEVLDAIVFDPRWTVASRQDSNPLLEIFGMYRELGFADDDDLPPFSLFNPNEDIIH